MPLVMLETVLLAILFGLLLGLVLGLLWILRPRRTPVDDDQVLLEPWPPGDDDELIP